MSSTFDTLHGNTQGDEICWFNGIDTVWIDPMDQSNGRSDLIAWAVMLSGCVDEFKGCELYHAWFGLFFPRQIR